MYSYLGKRGFVGAFTSGRKLFKLAELVTQLEKLRPLNLSRAVMVSIL